MTTKSPHICFVRCQILEVVKQGGYAWIIQGETSGCPARVNVPSGTRAGDDGLFIPKWQAERIGFIWQEQAGSNWKRI